MLNLKSRLANYRRVLQIARKPNKEEFVSSSKICALGMFIIGFVGFIIFIIFVFLPI